MIALFGLNHRSAPLPVRERVSFDERDLPAALRRLVETPSVREGMILSTCNRTEVLVRAEGGTSVVDELRDFLARERSITTEELERYGYRLEGEASVRHLFEVAVGLDSMILGEPQILGQVKRAHALAREAGTTGSILERLLQQCLSTAKRVRTETGISRHAVSVSYAAVTLARRIFGELTGRSVLLLGAGKMTELAARHLVANGADRIVVSNRTYDRAVKLAERIGGRAVNWDEGFTELERTDIVVTGTAAAHPVVGTAVVQNAMRARRQRPLFLIDIAVPRDVDPEVNTIDNVYLYDIDDLQGVVDSNMEQRKKAAEQARQKVQEEVGAFEKWVQSLEVTPTLVSLRQTWQEVGEREVERYRRRLTGLTPEQMRAVEELMRAVIGKLLHPPTRHLKQAAQGGHAAAMTTLYREIFDIDPVDRQAEEAPSPRVASGGGDA